MNVMVVEDDLISRKWLQRFLGKWGYEVTSYSDGEAAWTALESGEQPELVLADWMMPKMDGVELCRNIRNSPATKHAYIIILTARSEKTDLISGLEAGADDYLVKPVDPDELKTRLRVGERTLSLRSQLAERVSQLESMLRRHDILGEVYTRNLLADPEPEARPTRIPDQGLDRVAALLGHCFEQMGWTRRGAPSTSNADWEKSLTMGSSLVFPESGMWVDLAFRLSEESAAWWFESMMGRPPADRREITDGLIEAVNIVQSALRAAIGAAGQVAHAPFHPSPFVASTQEAAQGGKQVALESGRAQLMVVLTQYDLDVNTRRVRSLSESDVLGENVMVQLEDESLSIRSGCTPTAEWISRAARASDTERAREVRVLTKKTTGDAETVLFDPAELLGNTENDEELCYEIVRCFLSDNSTAFERVVDAVKQGDWSTAVEAAHSLKGSVSYFSRDVSREIARVESAAAHQNADEIRELAPHIRDTMARLIRELTAFLDTTSGPRARAS